MKTETQINILRKHLKAHKSIAPLQALNQYGIYRLAARIGELRDEGMNIKTKLIYVGPVKYAKYYI